MNEPHPRDVSLAITALDEVMVLHYPADNDPDRTPICAFCEGKAGVHSCGCWAEFDRHPVCGICYGPWNESVPYPCPTVALCERMIEEWL